MVEDGLIALKRRHVGEVVREKSREWQRIVVGCRQEGHLRIDQVTMLLVVGSPTRVETIAGKKFRWCFDGNEMIKRTLR